MALISRAEINRGLADADVQGRCVHQLHGGGGDLNPAVRPVHRIQQHCVEVVLGGAAALDVHHVAEREFHPVVGEHQGHLGLEGGVLQQVFVHHHAPGDAGGGGEGVADHFGAHPDPRAFEDVGARRAHGEDPLVLAIVDERALAVAAGNAQRHGVEGRADFRLADWYDGIDGQFDLIVSNPPYIPEAEIAELAPEVRLHEPVMALSPGPEGLEACRRIKADPALARTRVVVVSAKGLAADAQAGRDAGADEYLFKPFSPMGLLDTVERLAAG